MDPIVYVVERDVRNFFRYRWFLATFISMSLADLFIVAVVLTRMIAVLNYFHFFVPGVSSFAVFISAFMIGREVNAEARLNINQYLLSLPISKWKLVAGRLIAGGLRGLMYATPLTGVAFIILGLPSVVEILVVIMVLFLLSLGVSGLSISIAAAIRSFEVFATIRGVLYLVLFFFSTVFYPLRSIEETLPRPVALFAYFNPLSQCAEILRSILIYGRPLSVEGFTYFTVVTVIFVVVGLIVYGKALRA